MEKKRWNGPLTFFKVNSDVAAEEDVLVLPKLGLAFLSWFFPLPILIEVLAFAMDADKEGKREKEENFWNTFEISFQLYVI